ncbi:hypothetical protein AB0O52_17640 [Arthrobacter sp. NPDC080073]|uniref:hypothetical protein n=1 Tax=Arthrobacter sp. NPDC080073 TaxID=3155919 RepID=UPI003441DD1C
MASTFEALRQESDNRGLIRKVQKAVVLLRAASENKPLPTTLFAADGGLADFKTEGWLPVGMITPDGIEFGRDASEEEVKALGYSGAVRTDVTEVARSVKFTPLEHGRQHMLELAYGTDLSAVTQSATTGEIVFDEPEMPSNKEYQMLVLGVDGPADNQWLLGRAYGATKLSASDAQKWGSTDPVTTPLTMKVLTDAVTGVPLRHFMGGTGALKAKTVLGFTAAT